jgi:PAS domain S-box-containing protein
MKGTETEKPAENRKLSGGDKGDYTAVSYSGMLFERNEIQKVLEKNEQKLKETSDLLETILGNTSSMIACLDSNFNFIKVNEAYARADGRTADFYPGKNHFELFPNEENEAIFRNTAQTGEPYFAYAKPFEYEYNKERGVSYWDWSLCPVKDGNTISGFVLTLIDVTERIKAVQKVEESQKRLDSIISSAMDAIISIDHSHNIILFNDTAERIFLYNRQEIMGEHISILIPHEFRPNHDNYIKDFALNGTAVFKKDESKNHFALKKDGTLFPFESSVSQTVINGEKIFTIIIRDITDRKKSEEVLKLNEARFRYALENLPFSFTIYDADGRYQYMNAHARQILRKEPDQIIGRKDNELFSPEITDKYVPLLEKCIKTKKPQTSEFRITLLNRKMQLIATFIPILENEKIYQILGVFFNVTKQREAEESLNRLVEDLNRSNKELEQFAYIASHDLQEPLRMILWYTGFLSKKYKGQLDPKADEFINFITSAASRMSSLIRDLLSYGRINAVNKPFVFFECSDIIKDVIAIMRPQIEENNAVITYDNLPRIKGDPTLFRQLWQNLISNSIKFRSNLPPEITIGCEEKKNKWIFHIKDNGIGIETEFNEKVFEIFQQLHERDRYPGTGIGLAICRKIVERHGGKIWVESEQNSGAAFYFSIMKYS